MLEHSSSGHRHKHKLLVILDGIEEALTVCGSYPSCLFNYCHGGGYDSNVRFRTIRVKVHLPGECNTQLKS